MGLGLGLDLDLLCWLVWVQLWVLVNREALLFGLVREEGEKLVRKT